MQPVPFIRRVVFQHCTSTIHNLGFNPNKALARANIPMWHEGNPNDWVPFHDVMRALNVGTETIGTPYFGLMVGEANPMQFATFGRIIARSASLYDACRNCVRQINLLNSSAQFWITPLPEGILLCRKRLPWQMEQYVLRQMVSLVELATKNNWTPREAYVCAREVKLLKDTEFLANTNLHFNQPFTAIVIPRSLLAASIKLRIIDTEEENEIKFRRPRLSDDFVASISLLVESLLSDQRPKIELICDIVGISKRTLQRELAKNGVAYRELVGQARFKVARELLLDSDMALSEIAHFTGYSNETHFFRAFRNWAGTTPGAYRALNCLH